MQAYKPCYIFADAGHSTCGCNKNRKVTAGERCPSWKKWEKI
jgi:hypothetical protein